MLFTFTPTETRILKQKSYSSSLNPPHQMVCMVCRYNFFWSFSQGVWCETNHEPQELVVTSAKLRQNWLDNVINWMSRWVELSTLFRKRSSEKLWQLTYEFSLMFQNDKRKKKIGIWSFSKITVKLSCSRLGTYRKCLIL